MREQPNCTKHEGENPIPQPVSLRSQVQSVWTARRRAKIGSRWPARMLVFTSLAAVVSLLWSYDIDFDPEKVAFWRGILFWIAIVPTTGVWIIRRSSVWKSERVSRRLTNSLVGSNNELNHPDDVIAAISAINWTPNYDHRSTLADKLAPRLERIARAGNPELDIVALESLTEIVRCARRPLENYPSPELTVVSLKLIAAAGYVDALTPVEQLAVIYKPAAVFRAAGQCAGELRAIVEGSNETDHLLRASSRLITDGSELVRAVENRSSLESGEALRPSDETSAKQRSDVRD